MKQHFNIPFDQLNYEAQQNVIESIVPVLEERAKAEGEEMAKEYDNRVSWQECYMRAYSIQWRSYEGWGIGSKPDWFEWADQLKEEFERQAEIIARRYFSTTEIQVVI